MRPNIFMAREVFFCAVLRIHLSEFDEGLKEHSLDTKERFCVSGVSVIIMSEEPSRMVGFVI